MIFDIFSIFPEFFASPLNEGIVRRARQRGQVEINLINIRDFADDPQAMTDDRPFGGGEGMVMKPEPLTLAVRSRRQPESRVILLTPQGRRLEQRVVEELAELSHLLLICGRYEGVDERFCQLCVDDEISLGDFILSGGELAAMVVVDAVTRILPGVLGCDDSATKDTFSRGLLKHPQYTRPRSFEGLEVPEELLSGNHEKIEEFRFIASIRRTLARRPELLRQASFDRRETKWLHRHHLLEEVTMKRQNGQRA